MTSVDELLAESVRLYPVLYNKADKFFKDVNKKTWLKKLVFPQVIIRHVCLFRCCFDQKKTTKIWPTALFVRCHHPN